MKFEVCFFLISNLLTATIGDSSALKEYIQRLVRSGASPNVIDSTAHSLVLLKKGTICKTRSLLVWKGMYDDVPVALKITWGDGIPFMRDEMSIYDALNATRDSNIEKHRVPRIYYSGSVLGSDSYRGFAMTLFQETLNDRYLTYKRQNIILSNFSILMIFKQAVEVLEFLHNKHVIHNDVKPANIFLRDSEVFIGDFDLATLNGHHIPDHTEQFASSNAHAGCPRYAMDDIESLVFTMWYVAGMPPDESDQHEGIVLLESIRTGNAKSKMLEKCEYFTDEDVKQAFQYICVKQILSRSQVPDYKKIINRLKIAIGKITRKTGQMEFEWLREE